MGETLKVLIVEDSEDDMELLLRELRRGGFNPIHERVDTPDGLRVALAKDSWDIIVCDHRMPTFNSFAALDIIREQQLDIPFIVVSGTVGEAVAVETMRAGAHDYLMKDNLIRFVPVVERELREANSRRQRRRVEEQLRQSQKMEVIGQLTGGIAHDFNNLLGVIIGNLDFLEEELQDNAELLALTRAATKAALSGAALNRQLLAFSRKQTLSPKVIDLNEHISGLFNMLRRTLGETIEFETKQSQGPWTVKVDPAQLESALLNLAVNARDAMPRGGTLTIETKRARLDEDYAAARSEVTPGDYVMLSVSDTGTGMPPEVLAQVFEPFFTTKDVGKGSGLGLSMVFGFT